MFISILKKVWRFLADFGGVISTVGIFLFVSKYLYKTLIGFFHSHILYGFLFLILILVTTIFLLFLLKEKFIHLKNSIQKEFISENLNKIESDSTTVIPFKIENFIPSNLVLILSLERIYLVFNILLLFKVKDSYCMNCQNCKSPIVEDVKFCGKCGHNTQAANQNSREGATAKGKKVNSNGYIFDQVVRVLSLLIAFAVGKYLGLVFFLFLAAYLIGQWFPKWYLKREKINIKLVRFIVWSNLVSWLLPPLGIMTGFAALEFANHFPGDQKKYKTLAVIGIGASLLNATIGVLLNI